MVSLRHRLFEWQARRNPMPDPRDLDDLRERVAQQQAGNPISPPPALEGEYDVAALPGFEVDAECPAYSVQQRGTTPERTVFYLHGGGYVGHAAPQHWRFAGRLAKAADARVVVAQYPVAPRHTWRDAHPGVLEPYRKVAADTHHELALLGDSAGAGFALALAQRLVRTGEVVPARLVLITPWGDLSMEIAQPDNDPWMSRRFLALAGELWAGGDPPRSPELSPLFGEFAGLPPTLVMCGTKDVALPQSRAVVDAARKAGVPTTYVEGRGMLHDYPILNLPDARKAIGQIADFLAARPVSQGSTS